MKTIKVKSPEKCNGCELCVMECQRQLKVVGFDGAMIRIFKERNPKEKVRFKPDIDPKISRLNPEKIKAICPAEVFEVSEENDEGFIS